jgi:DNA-binding response OmpR family regulator
MNILVVDDSEKLRMGVILFLKKAGYTSIQEATGEQHAWTFLTTGQYSFDLVITDTQMEEDESGWYICQYVKYHFPNTKIILMSANAEMLERARQQNIPSDIIFDKGVGLPALVQIVRNLGITP